MRFLKQFSTYKGISYQEMLKIRKKNLNPALNTSYSKPLAIHRGYKQWLYDIQGKQYLDMFGGICTISVGHCHEEITRAVKEQMETLGHVSTLYLYDKIHEYAMKLSEKLPEKLKCIYFVNSGSEANDLALLLVRAYTGKYDVISLTHCYHGMTYQTMGLSSSNNNKYPTPGPGGFFKSLNPDPYRGIWGGNKCRDSPVQANRTCSCSNECEAEQNYVKMFENALKHNVAKNNLAAFWAESIQGVGGAIQYTKNYLKKVYHIVKEHHGLFVSDEVQTGFGRTGDHFWGFEGHGIVPDVITMAKGIGNGFPLAAVVTTPEIGSSLNKGGYFNTFGGNPITSAVGITVLDIIEREKLQENSKKVGTYLLKGLGKLRDKYSIIGDVRGKGLMIGVELVENSETKQPLNEQKFVKIWDNLLEQGVLVGRGGYNENVFRIKPPMCITIEDADFTINALENAIKAS